MKMNEKRELVKENKGSDGGLYGPAETQLGTALHLLFAAMKHARVCESWVMEC